MALVRFQYLTNVDELKRRLSRSEQRLRKHRQRVVGDVKSMTKQFGLLKLGIVGSLTAGGKALADFALDVQDSQALIQRNIGRIGEGAADALEQYEDARRQVVQGQAETAQAIAHYDTLLGLQGDRLERLTVLTGKFAQVTGSSLGSISKEVGQVFTAMRVGAADFEATLDTIYQTTAATGISATQLLADLRNYGPVLSQVGLDASEAAIFIGSLAAAGIDLSRVSPGINQFARRVADLGGDPRTALVDVIDRIRAAKTDTQALNIATEAFGAEGAVRMTEAVRILDLDLAALHDRLGETTVGIEEMADATETARERMGRSWENIKDRGAEALLTLGEGLNWLIDRSFPALGDALDRFAGIEVPDAAAAGTEFNDVVIETAESCLIFEANVEGLEAAIAAVGEEEARAAFEAEGLGYIFDALTTKTEAQTEAMQDLADATGLAFEEARRYEDLRIWRNEQAARNPLRNLGRDDPGGAGGLGALRDLFHPDFAQNRLAEIEAQRSAADARATERARQADAAARAAARAAEAEEARRKAEADRLEAQRLRLADVLAREEQAFSRLLPWVEQLSPEVAAANDLIAAWDAALAADIVTVDQHTAALQSTAAALDRLEESASAVDAIESRRAALARSAAAASRFSDEQAIAVAQGGGLGQEAFLRGTIGRLEQALADTLAAPADVLDEDARRRQAAGIARELTATRTQLDDLLAPDLHVVLRSDDKPDRRVRAEAGPVRSRPRGACG